jgi:hypothetical protein
LPIDSTKQLGLDVQNHAQVLTDATAVVYAHCFFVLAGSVAPRFRLWDRLVLPRTIDDDAQHPALRLPPKLQIEQIEAVAFHDPPNSRAQGIRVVRSLRVHGIGPPGHP